MCCAAAIGCTPGTGEGDGGTGQAGSSSGGVSGESGAATQTDGPGDSGADAADGNDTPPPPVDSDGSGTGTPVDCNEDELSAMYTRYVEPFVTGAVPQSCGQCHMTGIDMSMYAQDTACDTMACMVGQGVVDLSNPDQSSLLTMIDMGDPNSSVFDVKYEHAAMLEWIEWSAACHEQVCGDVESPCEQSTGANSTGVNPIGDCSEEDLLATYWNTVTVDRGRCMACHSDWGQDTGTFDPCNADSECDGPQVCHLGNCSTPGPVSAPHFFEGLGGEGSALDWNDPADRLIARNSMYNIVALGLLDVDNPVESTFITKPLLEGFTPTAVFGPNVNMPNMPAGDAEGIVHGGTSKFNFGCHEEPCPTEGVVDCRVDTPCAGGDAPCPDGLACTEEGLCRVPGSVCDPTLVAYYDFARYFAQCKGE